MHKFSTLPIASWLTHSKRKNYLQNWAGPHQMPLDNSGDIPQSEKD
jgi:hypothetical protein